MLRRALPVLFLLGLLAPALGAAQDKQTTPPSPNTEGGRRPRGRTEAARPSR